MNTTVRIKTEQVRIKKTLVNLQARWVRRRIKKTPGKPGVEADCKSDITLDQLTVDNSLWSYNPKYSGAQPENHRW
jgi:hypothetical protein